MTKEADNRERDNRRRRKRTLLSWFYSNQRLDPNFLPELKRDWSQLRGKKRRQFLLGIAAGLIIFVILLALVILILRGLLGTPFFHLIP